MTNIGKFSLVLFIIFSAECLHAQTEIAFPDFSHSDIKKVKEKVFTGETLFGHINGGAELYFEYGFNNLTYREYHSTVARYVIEVYNMQDAAAAFGIFSLKKYRCIEMQGPTPHYCETGHQILLGKGNYFISIAMAKSSEKEKAQAREIANLLISNIPENLDFNPSNVYGYNSQEKDFRLFRGKLGFQNGLLEWEQLLEGYNNYTCLHFREKNPSPSENFYVEFSTESEVIDFMKKAILENRIKSTGDKKQKWDIDVRGNKAWFKILPSE